MNPVTKAIAGGLTRHLLVMMGTYGVELPFDALEPVINGLLILGPLAWSAWQKKKTVDPVPDPS